MREIKIKLYFDNKFIGYEKWTERGWMYSQDDLHWEFQPEYAHSIKAQFTGLHDRNGKPIYEGDVVSWMTAEREAVRGKIVWIDDMVRFGLLLEGEDDAHGFLQKEAQERFEVIGNIYENPELIK